MDKSIHYKTKQMEELLSFLKSVKGKHVTVSDICNYFQKERIPVGMTTVYRNLEKLVEKGLVEKYVTDGSSSAYFEYVGEEPHNRRIMQYHCKCEKCGKFIHFECSEVGSLQQHLLEHHDFKMNTLKTVFYGVCSACKERQ